MPTWHEMDADQGHRWAEVLDVLARLLPSGCASVVIDGAGTCPAVVADRLAATLSAAGRHSSRLTDAAPVADEDAWMTDRGAQTVAVADGPRWRVHPPGGRWDVTVWLRTAPAGHHHTNGSRHPVASGEGDGEHGADVVIDLHDPAWPVIRHVATRLADHHSWYLTESRAFFAVRAATWDLRFGHDIPAYTAAISEAGLPPGGVVVDVGCGTGRALPGLRAAVGESGVVLGLDLTPQMLAVARAQDRADFAELVLADARHLPLGDTSVDAIFAAGLVMHLPEVAAGLRELARITRPGGTLVLFHPSGRAALAARHGRTLLPDDRLAEGPLRDSMDQAGWRLTRYDDPPHRFFALGVRR